MSEMNPLLAKVKLPGRTFQLPSRASMYTNGEIDPSVKNGEIHVYPMTAMTEINLKNPDLLFNGKALETVALECIPALKKPLELYGRDVDAIMFFLRLATYGAEYRIEVKHDCEDAKEHSYVVNLEEIVQRMTVLDPTIIQEKRNIRLPNDQVVCVRPMRFLDVIELFHYSEGKKELDSDDIKELARINLLSMIEKVDDISDPVLIKEWINSLTSPMVNRINEAATALNQWGVDQIASLTCKDCGQEMRVELPMNPVSFFTE